MIGSIKKKAADYWLKWVNKRHLDGNPQIINNKNIYILPSTFGWIYGVVLFTFFSGAINYQISTIFLLTFLLAVIGLISAWEAHQNVQDISLKLVSVADTQQGKPAQLVLFIQAQKIIRYSLEFQIDQQPIIRLEKIPEQGIQFTLPIKTTTRGYFPVPRMMISSLFPFGIFRVWTYARFNEHYYVYPQPISPNFWPIPIAINNDNNVVAKGDDELYELIQVNTPWASPNRIAWKIAAKGQGWYLKTMNSHEAVYWLFNLTDLHHENLEIALQHLSYWLNEAEYKGYFYSLALKGKPGPFAQGQAHLQQSLRQLALYS